MSDLQMDLLQPPRRKATVRTSNNKVKIDIIKGPTLVNKVLKKKFRISQPLGSG